VKSRAPPWCGVNFERGALLLCLRPCKNENREGGHLIAVMKR
jgi:hypothetical protein